MLREFPVPPGHQDRAALWLQHPHRPAAAPRDASTVLLARDGPQGVELFILRRHTTMAFAGGLHAFPGGGVDPRDAADDVPWAGPGPDTWGGWLRTTPRHARAFVCAAVRETFEECGVLLAAGRAGAVAIEAADEAQWESERRQVASRGTAMSDLLRRWDLVLRSDLLRPWAHWTTPVYEPRRFDTRFLVAVVPPGQTARHVPAGESAASRWWPAVEVLERHARGEMAMLPPTLVAVEEAARAPDAETLWATPRTVRRVLPVLERRGDDVVLVADLPEQP